MKGNQGNLSPARTRTWGWIVVFAVSAILLADAGMGLASIAQLRQREQAIPSQWKHYDYPTPVPENMIYARLFTVDALGRVWASTPPDGGLSMLHPDGTWTTYTTQNSGLPADDILALESDETGRIAVMTSKGVGTFAPDGTWVSYLKGDLPPLFTTPNIAPYSLAFGNHGDIWISAQVTTILYRIPGDGTWVSYEKRYPAGSLQAVDKQGTVWVGGGFPGLFKQNQNGDWRFLPMPGQTEEYVGETVQDVELDPQGQLWVAADRDGLFLVDPEGRWTPSAALLQGTLLFPSSLRYRFGPSGGINLKAKKVAVDSRGNVWFASDGCTIPRRDYYQWCGLENEYRWQNLSKLSPDGRLITYSSQYRGLTDVNDRVLGLGVDPQGRVWIGHSGGVTAFDETSPFQTHTDLYTELIMLSARTFWSETIAVWSILGLGLAASSALGLLDRSAILWFAAGFLGWFVLNSIIKYLPFLIYFLNLHFCPFYESGYPDCTSLFGFGLILLMLVLNGGILVSLFKARKRPRMWGFVLAFGMNLIMQYLLGSPQSSMFVPNFLMPFFL